MSIEQKPINESLERDRINSRITELEAECYLKSEQLARYDDRVRALRKALSGFAEQSGGHYILVGGSVADEALEADDKAKAEMPE